jgi:hypothetical protein
MRVSYLCVSEADMLATIIRLPCEMVENMIRNSACTSM